MIIVNCKRVLDVQTHYDSINIVEHIESLRYHYVIESTFIITIITFNRIKLDSVIFVVEINQIRQLGRSFYSFLSSDNQHVSEARHTALRLSIRIKCT